MNLQRFILLLMLPILTQASTQRANHFKEDHLVDPHLHKSPALQNQLGKQFNADNVDILREDFSRSKRSTATEANTPVCRTNRTSCVGRCSEKRMFHNIEENKDYPECYCDPECDQVFSDCCADYVEECRPTPNRLPDKKIHQDWSCFNMKDFTYKIWMIGECRADWPRNDSNVQDCARFSATDPKASWVTPVRNSNTTYRNRYCALCNGVTTFTRWRFSISCKIFPPRNDTMGEKLKHVDKYCSGSKISFKSQTVGIRYCYDVVKTCKTSHDVDASQDCKQGTTRLLYAFPNTYRNFGCLLCNSKRNEEQANVTCGPRKKTPWSWKVQFSFIFGRVDDFIPTDSLPQCSKNQIYDNAAGVCRKLFVQNGIDDENSFLKQFAVRIFYKQMKTDTCLTEDSSTSRYLRQQGLLTSLRKKFDAYLAGTRQNTTIQWRFHDLEIYNNENNTSFLVTFQILRAQSGNETINSSFFIKELEIEQVEVNFPYGGKITGCSYFLTNILTRAAICLENQTYPVNMHGLKSTNGSVYLNITQMKYKSGEYLVYQSQNETRIALCHDSKPAHCSYYLHVTNRTHWKTFSNRSIYSLVTKSWFHYGDYSLGNGTVWLCLTDDHTRQTRRRTSGKPSSSVHQTILKFSSIASLSVSIISLIILLVVYSKCSALRNLPGKNLMLFSGILALAQTTWLVQNKLASQWPSLCPTINVVMQYLFLASFSSPMSIAIQSFLTFQGLAKGKLRQRSTESSFLKYAMFGLGLPFLFVIVCVILDTTNVVPFKYGTSDGHCWFGDTSILNTAFLYPAFLLLLCNMSLFFATLRAIYQCTKASQQLAKKTEGANKNHVGIYIRMSTIMGFTWLSGVLNIIFPHVVVFEYIFVFVNGFQGLYLSFAFLSTTNLRKVISGRNGKELWSTTKRFNATATQEM